MLCSYEKEIYNIGKYIPIEEEIYLNQDRYYEVINECHNNGNANKFIEFMLKMIDETLEQLVRDIYSLGNQAHSKDNIYTKEYISQGIFVLTLHKI